MTLNIPQKLKLFFGFVLVLMLAGICKAQQKLPLSETDSTKTVKNLDFVLEDHNFDISLPIWIPGFRGSFAYGGISTLPSGPDTDFGQRITDSELGVEFYLIGRIRFRQGRFILQADGFNSVLGTDLTFYDREILTYEGTIKGTILRGMVGFRVYTRTDPDRYLRWSVDVYGGVRHYAMHIYSERLDLIDIRPSWTDPIVGVSASVSHRKWIFEGQLDFGGFGIHNRRSWYSHAGAQYRFSKLFSLGAGWAFLDFETEKDIELKTMFLGMRLTGPVITAQFSF